MKQISEFEKILAQFLNWNKSRINCLAQILQALFCVRTVNLAQIAEAFQSSVKEDSSYRRVQRFFREFSFDMSAIVPIVLNLFMLKGKFTLMMDRTNWQWGKKHLNIFMLTIDYHGIGIPLFWMLLNSAGMTTTKERIQLLERVLIKFGLDKIEVLLADREFIGEEWFKFLIEKNIPFVIRVKNNTMIGGLCQGCEVPIRELIIRTNCLKKRITNHKVILRGQTLYASAEYAKGAKEPLIVLSNRLFRKPVQLYRKRWGIETLFSCLKTRGFRMEDTHMTDQIKIEKLVFILAIAFCWALKAGEIKAKEAPIKIKNHGRKAKSVFRLGLSWIRSIMLVIETKVNEFIGLITSLKYSICIQV